MRDEHLRRDYERVRAANPEANLPAYDDMTDEQRESHRQSHDRLHGFMSRLGDAIRTGGDLPDPFAQ